MRKDTTILVLCGLFLLADGFCFGRTIDARDAFDQTFLSLALGAEIAAAFLFVWIGWNFTVRIYSRGRPEKNFRTLALNFPRLSRKFLSVWF